jgi:hypothetical protein
MPEPTIEVLTLSTMDGKQSARRVSYWDIVEMGTLLVYRNENDLPTTTHYIRTAMLFGFSVSAEPIVKVPQIVKATG